MFDQIGALVLFALVATGSPGGATTLATASGARFGYRRTIPLILGIAAALAGLVAVSGTGLAVTLQSSPFLEIGVKAAGSIYLLYLAAKIGMAGPPKPAGVGAGNPITFLGGAMLLLINPKAWAMAVGVASSFSDIASDPFVLGGLLAGVFACSAGISLSAWAVAGGAVARSFNSDRHWHVFNGFMAALLAGSIAQFWL